MKPGDRILVVDFDPVSLRETSALLRQTGGEIVAAASVQEVRDALADGPPRAVVIEPALAGYDGFELCRSLLEACEPKPAVLMASRALGGREAADRAREAGAQMFLERPAGDALLVRGVQLILADLEGAEPDEVEEPGDAVETEPQVSPELVGLDEDAFAAWVDKSLDWETGPATSAPSVTSLQQGMRSEDTDLRARPRSGRQPARGSRVKTADASASVVKTAGETEWEEWSSLGQELSIEDLAAPARPPLDRSVDVRVPANEPQRPAPSRSLGTMGPWLVLTGVFVGALVGGAFLISRITAPDTRRGAQAVQHHTGTNPERQGGDTVPGGEPSDTPRPMSSALSGMESRSSEAEPQEAAGSESRMTITGGTQGDSVPDPTRKIAGELQAGNTTSEPRTGNIASAPRTGEGSAAGRASIGGSGADIPPTSTAGRRASPDYPRADGASARSGNRADSRVEAAGAFPPEAADLVHPGADSPPGGTHSRLGRADSGRNVADTSPDGADTGSRRLDSGPVGTDSSQGGHGSGSADTDSRAAGAEPRHAGTEPRHAGADSLRDSPVSPAAGRVSSGSDAAHDPHEGLVLSHPEPVHETGSAVAPTAGATPSSGGPPNPSPDSAAGSTSAPAAAGRDGADDRAHVGSMRPGASAPATAESARDPDRAARNRPSGETLDHTEPRLINRVDPVYPQAARMMRQGGLVFLSAIVRVDGRLSAVEVVSEPPGTVGLGNAAMRAVRQWRYEPARQGDAAVEAPISIQVEFKP